MKPIYVKINEKNACFMVRDDKVKEKLLDVTVINEILENVYQFNPQMLVSHGIVLDIGAFTGIFSVYAALMGAKKVYAFEPNPKNYEVLVENILNNNLENVIIPIDKAIVPSGNKATLVDDFYNSAVVDNLKLESEESKKTTQNEHDSERFTAEAMTLGEAYEKFAIPECDFIKMDIEWSEYPIIESLDDQTLAKARNISMEFHGTTAEVFGSMVSKLTKNFCVNTIGSFERGGYIHARRY